MKLYNWLIKQIFYFRYLIMKQDKGELKNGFFIYKDDIIRENSFYSSSFSDGQWNKFLPWHSPEWPFQDWNTYGYFKQAHGKFYFKAKLGKYIIRQPYFSDIWPAIWLLNMASKDDVAAGKADHPYYYEIDIELFKKHFGYTIQFNHNGPQEGAVKLRANFGSHRLYRNLQKEYHLFLIDWNKDWIRFYINGILTAKFKNEIHVPLQIIISHCSMTKTIVQK